MKDLTQSAEDYLEAILAISRERPVVRTSEVAARLNVKMPSVVTALRGLAARGLLRHERYGYVELTGTGRAAARRVMDRHATLARFLNGFLGIDSRTAETDACRMEHALSPRTMKRLVEFLEFVGEEPVGPRPCVAEFEHFRQTGERRRCRV